MKSMRRVDQPQDHGGIVVEHLHRLAQQAELMSRWLITPLSRSRIIQPYTRTSSLTQKGSSSSTVRKP